MIIITLGLWELLALTTMLWVISILQVTLFTRVKYDLLINLILKEGFWYRKIT